MCGSVRNYNFLEDHGEGAVKFFAFVTEKKCSVKKMDYSFMLSAKRSIWKNKKFF